MFDAEDSKNPRKPTLCQTMIQRSVEPFFLSCFLGRCGKTPLLIILLTDSATCAPATNEHKAAPIRNTKTPSSS